MTLYFCMLLLKARQNHIKVISTNILCSESNGSQGWFPSQVKIETKARFLAKRPAGATGGHAHKRNFASCFLFRNRLSMQIFIKIWYTESNIVKN